MPPLSHLTPCTLTKSNLYLANSLAAAVRETALYRLLISHVSNLTSPFRCSVRAKVISPVPMLSVCLFRRKIRFYDKNVLAPRPTSKLVDHPSSALLDCLFNIFAATFHTGSRSSIRNLRTRHAVVTGTNLSRPFGNTNKK